MKKYLLTAAILFALSAGFATAKELPPEKDTYDYDSLVESIKGVTPPFVSGDFVVFTAVNTARFIGIAFDFEEFKTIHPFRLHKLTDADGKETNSWFFFILDRPRGIKSISYRLVVDGLWTTDPENDVTYFNSSSGILLSKLDLNITDPPATDSKKDGLTRFICNAPSGEKIRLGGTFSNWDSWIYELTEVAPGRYEIDLPLPTGTYYYNYYRGMTSFIDSTNPEKGYTADGRIASCITIK